MTNKADDSTSALGPRTDAAGRRTRGTGRLRIEDVARLAQVSPQTVSRLLRSPEKVAEATAIRIREVIAASGYVPNVVAGSLASNRCRVVAVVVPTVASSIHAVTVDSLSEVLDRAGYQVLLASTGYSQDREDRAIAALIERRVDGLVITGGGTSAMARLQIAAAGIPVVQTWELPSDPIDMAVGLSNQDAGGAVARLLESRGCRRTVIIAHAAADTRSVARVAGFLAAASTLPVQRPKVLTTEHVATPGDGEAILDNVLAVDPDADSVFAVSDQIAAALVLACQRRGIAIPGSLAVVGFGDAEIAAQLNPSLTTIRVPPQELGKRAAEMLLARFAGHAVPNRIVDVGFKLIERDSIPKAR